MNRRQFCYRGAAAAICAVGKSGVSQVIATVSGATTGTADEIYALWSLLIPVLQPQPGRGYMIAQKTAIPDALPYLQTGSPLTGIEKARRAAVQQHAPYETFVPSESQASFAEAIAQATQQQTKVALIERRFSLVKHYRLLSDEQAKAYFDLSPHVVMAGWKPDPKAAREYKDWNEFSSISLPYFDNAHSLALIWASTSTGCYSAGWWFFKRTEHGWERQNWRTEMRNMCA